MENKTIETNASYDTGMQIRNCICACFRSIYAGFVMSLLYFILSYLYFYNISYFHIQSKFESVALEVLFTEGEIKQILMNIKDWSADEKVRSIFILYLQCIRIGLHVYYFKHTSTRFSLRKEL